jgi:hypothetical protein
MTSYVTKYNNGKTKICTLEVNITIELKNVTTASDSTAKTHPARGDSAVITR